MAKWSASASPILDIQDHRGRQYQVPGVPIDGTKVAFVAAVPFDIRGKWHDRHGRYEAPGDGAGGRAEIISRSSYYIYETIELFTVRIYDNVVEILSEKQASQLLYTIVEHLLDGRSIPEIVYLIEAECMPVKRHEIVTVTEK